MVTTLSDTGDTQDTAQTPAPPATFDSVVTALESAIIACDASKQSMASANDGVATAQTKLTAAQAAATTASADCAAQCAAVVAAIEALTNYLTTMKAMYETMSH